MIPFCARFPPVGNRIQAAPTIGKLATTPLLLFWFCAMQFKVTPLRIAFTIRKQLIDFGAQCAQQQMLICKFMDLKTAMLQKCNSIMKIDNATKCNTAIQRALISKSERTRNTLLIQVSPTMHYDCEFQKFKTAKAPQRGGLPTALSVNLHTLRKFQKRWNVRIMRQLWYTDGSNMTAINSALFSFVK